MAVTPEYRDFVLEQLGRVAPVTHRAMFGGVGVYSEGLFFALLDDDTTYLKVDDGNRDRFQAAGMRPFDPFGDGQQGRHQGRDPGQGAGGEEGARQEGRRQVIAPSARYPRSPAPAGLLRSWPPTTSVRSSEPPSQ